MCVLVGALLCVIYLYLAWFCGERICIVSSLVMFHWII